MKQLCFLVLGLCLALGPWAHAGEVDALLSKTLEAYGGRSALEAVGAVRQTGLVHALIRHAGQTGKLVRLFQAPEKLRVEIAYPDAETEVRILNGKKGWRDGRPVQGPPLEAMRGQLYRLDLPLVLIRNKASLIDRGLVDHGSKEFHQLELPFPKGITLVVEIDPRSGRILGSRVAFPAGPNFKMQFATVYSDFREVGGVLFPFREQNFAQGQHTADTELDLVEILEEALAGAFAPRSQVSGN